MGMRFSCWVCFLSVSQRLLPHPHLVHSPALVLVHSPTLTASQRLLAHSGLSVYSLALLYVDSLLGYGVGALGVGRVMWQSLLMAAMEDEVSVHLSLSLNMYNFRSPGCMQLSPSSLCAQACRPGAATRIFCAPLIAPAHCAQFDFLFAHLSVS